MPDSATQATIRRGDRAPDAAVAPGVGVLLQLLRDGQPRTRAELAKVTGLARSTIALRVDSLMRAGLVTPVGEAASTGGRPPATFAFAHDARIVLAADVGATHVRLAVTDLAAQVLGERVTPLQIDQGPVRVLQWIADQGHDLLAEVGRDPRTLIGIGVGLPGPVEHSSGRPINPPIMPGWDGFDVPGWLRDRFGVPVLVDNDVNIMAIGEHFVAWSDHEHLFFVKVATGIGSGIVSDGRLNRGAHGAAGDVGHTQVPHGADVVCRCGNSGCLEAIASGSAVAAKLEKIGVAASGSSDVVRHARAGRMEAVQLVRQAGRDIGEVLATCVNLLNPSVVVIGGSLSEAGEHLLAGVREVVYTRSLPLATQHLQVVQSRTGERAAIIGAAVMVIEHALSPEVLEAG